MVSSSDLNLFRQSLTLSWRRLLSYRNQSIDLRRSIDLQSKSMDWFLYDNGLRHERVNLSYSENKLFKTLNYYSRDMLNFYFLEKGLGIVSTPHFVHDFFKKMFLMLYSINGPNLIAWFPFFSRYWPICVLKLFVDQVVT